MSDERTFGERVSDEVTYFGGSWKFIFIFSAFLFFWILLNSLKYFNFDNYPFILLNLILSFVAAFQAPFIMMSQNRTEKKQDEAYRILFKEIKELVEEDLREEIEIKTREDEIMRELKEIKEYLHILLKEKYTEF